MWRSPHRRNLELLVVEDNPAEILLLEEVLAEAEVALELRVVNNGEEGLAYLRREGRYANASRPDLIMLDLNLPGLDGRQVLGEIKEDPNLLAIPVIILSTSQAEEDIAECYRMQANCYISKPVGLEEFIEVVRAIESFWFRTVKLPH
ncbi:MAG TPA: response regulator [Desulfurivibrionaceae bacterium]|nr:response regulator [Desulfurivibrionaceae bacterium]